MENEEAKSKWDDLARELGAEAVSESSPPKAVPTEQDELSAARSTSTVRESREKASPVPAKRPATDWNALNTELGLEPLPVPEPPKSESAPRPTQATTRREENIRRDERAGSKERPPREQEDRARRDKEQAIPSERRRSDRPRQPSQSREEERDVEQGRTRGERRPQERSRASRSQRDASHRGEARSRRTSEEPSEPATSRTSDRTRQESRQGRSRRHDERDQDSTAPNRGRNHRDERRALDEEVAAHEEQPIEREPEPPKPASVSLWHKIFGLPAEQSAKLTGAAEQEAVSREEVESAPRKEASRSGDSRRETPTRGSASEVDDLDRAMDRSEFEPADDRSIDGPEDHQVEGSDDQRQRRPRRRRRGGRKSGERQEEAREVRKSSRRRDVDENTLDGLDTPDDFDDEFAGSPVRTTDSARPDFDLDDNELDEDLHDTGTSSTKSPSHRGIPSWNEAIGAIVDLNLQSRSQRRHSAQAHGHASAPRGRARGGRRKKKS